MRAANVADYRILARRRLPRFLFEYIDGGSHDEITLARNVSDLQEVALRQRVMRDVGQLDLTATLFGQTYRMPVALAPIGLGGMTARRGERQAVRAAEKAGIPFTLSTVSACALAEVKAAATKPFWFQLYMTRDRGFVTDLLAKAQEAGCSALVFTVDMALPGARYRDVRTGLSGNPGLPGKVARMTQALQRPAWCWDVGVHGRPHVLGNLAPLLKGKTGLDDYFGWMKGNFDGSVTWKDLDFIRERWTGPLIIKGVLDIEDARSTARLGADGLVVSNHGGRQLDGALSSARALPAIADAVGDRLTVLADGGVRSGLDVVRMLALGAKGVMIGRPWVWALGAGGQKALDRVLALFESEIRVAMSLTGCRTLAEIDRTALVEAREHLPALQ
jgi:L-lactate dehydrogenase (cytochrome)